MDQKPHLFERDMLSRQRLHEQIATRIEELIFSGELKIGDRLPPEIEMAEQFGVHRSTAREALRLLQQRGLVEMKVGSGTYVSRVSPSVVAESVDTFYFSNESSYEDFALLRSFLEPGIAALAALRAQPEDLEVLAKALRKLEKAFATEELDKMVNADIDFHFALATASHNKLLFAIFSGIRNVWQRELKTYSERYPTEPEERAQILRNHHELFDAIRAGDPVRARKQIDLQIRSLFDIVEEIEPLDQIRNAYWAEA